MKKLKKMPRWFWIVLALAAFIVLIAALAGNKTTGSSCDTLPDGSPSSTCPIE